MNEDTGWLPASIGQKVCCDVFGSIQYGMMLSRFGVRVDLAIAESNMDGTGKENEGHVDDPFIRLGYQLAAKYPKGPTEAQFEEWFKDIDIQSALEATGKVQ